MVSTSEDICHLYIVPHGSTTWGPSLLEAGKTIAPNASQSFPKETGMYDLMAENCNKQEISKTSNLHVHEHAHWVAKEEGASTEASTSETVLEVINNTSEDVCYLYISPSTNDDNWGDNWISESERIPIGQTRTFSVETGTYDVRAETCQKEVIAEFFDQHLEGNMEWELVNRTNP